MSATSKIQWTEATWNPTVGCTKVSAGCDHCYAETFVNRFAGTKGFPQRFDTMVIRPHFLEKPLHWKTPRRIFVNSLSDLFHQDVPDSLIARVWEVMAATPQHTYQLLTKRHGRMRSLLRSDEFLRMVDLGGAEYPLRNVWLGVSAENQDTADLRIPVLMDTPAAVRWVSAEPLLGPLDVKVFSLLRVDWVVVGGESGPGARLMQMPWALRVIEDCETAGVPVFVKQLGSVAARSLGLKHPKGGDIDEWPPSMQVRQYPAGAA